METLNDIKTKRYFVVGVLLLVFGIIAMIENLGLYLPFWVVSWHTILLAVGLLIGYRKNFKTGGWIILVFIGALFTLDSIITISLSLYMPALILIGVGLYLLLKPAKVPANFDHFKEH